METAQAELAGILSLAPVIPVIVIEDADHAAPLAKALVRGGLRAIEVTLRTESALAAIAAMSEVEGAIVGAGTVLNAAHFSAARKAGARFAVSPGATPSLLDAAAEFEMPFLPGIATASEAIVLIERGYRFAKFFPAEVSGGAAMVKALASPLPQLQLCPTGGITPGNAAAYLSLPNVVCVGGTWIASATDLAQRDWDGIASRSRSAALLRQSQ